MEILTVNNGEGTYEISIPLVSRIMYLRGDSGVGKTTLTELITTYNTGDPDIYVKLPDGFSIEVLVSINNIRSDINTRINTIMIIDDNLGTENPNFSKDLESVLRNNNSYLIIINRVDIIEDSLNSEFAASLEYSVDSVLWVSKNENTPIRTVSKFVDMFPILEDISGINTILCEDTYGMKEFCTSHSYMLNNTYYEYLVNLLKGE